MQPLHMGRWYDHLSLTWYDLGVSSEIVVYPKDNGFHKENDDQTSNFCCSRVAYFRTNGDGFSLSGWIHVQ